MAGSGFHVDPGALDRHAGSVDQAADTVDQAASAGEHVRLGGLAYGAMNWVLPLALNGVQEEAVAAAKESAHALRTVADTLRDLSIRYRNAEEEHERLMSNFFNGITDIDSGQRR